ncbi:MAG: phosphotransferase, partial [Trebonia sp.]
MKPSPEELLRVLQEQGLREIAALTPTDGGESGSAYWARDRSGEMSIVKVQPVTGPDAESPDAESQVRRLDATVRRLRERGYPAPRLLDVGCAGGMQFWRQELLPGSTVEMDGTPDFAAIGRLLPELLRLNDTQAGLGSGAPRLGDLLRTTLAVGGDGYCVHATLRDDPRTRDLLAIVRNAGERYAADVPDRGDYVHYDFNTANILSDGTAVTGVIDINAPVISGDRAFDLATLLFYVYDHDGLRDGLRTRLLELDSPGVAAVYLAHMVLR